MQCFVLRGLEKEIEEDINKFLSSHPTVKIVHMTQSSTGEYISVTLIYEETPRL